MVMNPMHKLARILRFLIVPTLLIALLALLGPGCGKPQPPEYYGFQDTRLGKATGGQTTVSTTIKLYNPNHFSLQLRGGEMDVYVNGKLSGHSLLDTTIFIPKKDTFYVPLNLKINPKILISSAIRMLMNDNTIKVRLEGSIRVKRGAIGFNVPVNYEVTQKMQ